MEKTSPKPSSAKTKKLTLILLQNQPDACKVKENLLKLLKIICD
jgi:hypothetical protein